MKTSITRLVLIIVSLSLSALLKGQSGCKGNCIDLSNLHDASIKCYYGEYNNPYMHEGVNDLGPDNEYSNHTVITSQGTDERTGNQLQMIPDGEDYSVRLGNWNIGGEAESILCTILVDTNDFDLLVLRYAAVMEDRQGAHNPEIRPRFTMEILDENDNPIDHDCTFADFHAVPELGWNESEITIHGHSSIVYWNDWTSVGLDVAPYHGRSIKVRLVTYDCHDGGCFGYAYFRLDCSKKDISKDFCGESSVNTFSAPDGFNYKWYLENSPNVIISTERTITLEMAGNDVLCCFVSFIENPDCGFELRTTAYPSRFPIAEFDFEETYCPGTYMFNNNSYVSYNGPGHASSREPCSGALWRFGDGTVSEEYEPMHHFNQPGDYEVELVALLSNGECRDSISMMVHVETEAIAFDTVPVFACDSYSWNGQTYSEDGLYSQRFESHFGCDSIVYISLSLGSTNENSVGVETCEATYWWNGIEYDSNGVYEQILQNQQGCDSIVTMQLTFHDIDNVMVNVDTCAPSYIWNNSVYDSDGVYERVFENQFGCDSVVTLYLTVGMSRIPENVSLEYLGPGNPHYVISATEFQINSYEFAIIGSLGEIEWSSTDWHLEGADWIAESSEDGLNCTVMPLTFTNDSVWLVATLTDDCSGTIREFRHWMQCSFYDVEEREGWNGFSVSPNPTSGNVNLHFDAASGKTNVKVFDMRSVLLDEFHIAPTETTDFQYDFSFGKGIYFIVAECEGKIHAEKIVVF